MYSKVNIAIILDRCFHSSVLGEVRLLIYAGLNISGYDPGFDECHLEAPLLVSKLECLWA